MHERTLRDFFIAAISAPELSRDLEGSLVSSGTQSIHHPIVDMPDDFEVRPEHLVRLCDAVLAGDIQPWMLESIGFCFVASDKFWWDGDTDEGKLVARTAYNWAAPEINFPLTPATVVKFRHRLTTGESTFSRADTRPPVV